MGVEVDSDFITAADPRVAKTEDKAPLLWKQPTEMEKALFRVQQKNPGKGAEVDARKAVFPHLVSPVFKL